MSVETTYRCDWREAGARCPWTSDSPEVVTQLGVGFDIDDGGQGSYSRHHLCPTHRAALRACLGLPADAEVEEEPPAA